MNRHTSANTEQWAMTLLVGTLGGIVGGLGVLLLAGTGDQQAFASLPTTEAGANMNIPVMPTAPAITEAMKMSRSREFADVAEQQERMRIMQEQLLAKVTAYEGASSVNVYVPHHAPEPVIPVLPPGQDR